VTSRTFFTITFLLILFVSVSSVVGLIRAQVEADAQATENWRTILTTCVVLGVVLVLLLFGRQAFAIFRALLSRRVPGEVAIVVSGWGARSLTSAPLPKFTYFSRVLIADSSGLSLWLPFRRGSSLPWEQVGSIDLDTDFDIGRPRLVLRVRRAADGVVLRLLPQSQEFAGWAKVTEQELKKKIADLGTVRNGAT